MADFNLKNRDSSDSAEEMTSIEQARSACEGGSDANGESSEDGDTQPLLIRAISRNLAASSEGVSFSNRDSKRVLNTFAGVFVPVALSQFSTTVFLRLGFVIGQSGILFSLIQFLLAYAILVLTVLSICAISTNGAVEGGGAYYMISRALGPEFGGSIGLLFFLANIFSCAVYVVGVVEGVTDMWGSPDGTAPGLPLPTGRWYVYGYGTVVSLFCLGICLIGSQMFAKTSAVTLGILVVCIVSQLVSTMAQKPMSVNIPCENSFAYTNTTVRCGQLIDNNKSDRYYLTENFTGLSWKTFSDNFLNSSYTQDYTNPDQRELNFFMVFAVLFTGVTGIMNGANMSGELKDPGKSLPKGTLLAVLFTYTTYTSLLLFTAASTSRALLQENYNFMSDVNLWPPFVFIGILSATLSAALGNLIGASRVLHALSKDDLFWIFTRPARIVNKAGNPWMALIIAWVFVQLIMLIGSMNAISPMTTIFFLLSYASTNTACLALDLAAAPNFRPTFKYFSWWTCLIGLVGCIVMTFLIDPIYASIAIGSAMILIIVLYLRSVNTSWGSISQALIFHQVRKYLLLLDNRKDHIKFWRPSMLFMVSNPRHCSNTIDFINDLKKSGLYILGHVKVGNLDDRSQDPALLEQKNWLSLVDYLKVKAFVEITVAHSVREGLQQLVRLSGLGGMKPNTVCLGFYDNAEPQDSFSVSRSARKKKWGFGAVETAENNQAINYFHSVRLASEAKIVPLVEYVAMVKDCLKMQKNVCLFRHFDHLNKANIFSKKTYIDVWPMDPFEPEKSGYVDNCCLYILQLACVLRMVDGWKKHTNLRVFMCHASSSEELEMKKKNLAVILHQLRIIAEIVPVDWTQTLNDHYPEQLRNRVRLEMPVLPKAYLTEINRMIRRETDNTSVVFCYLPLPPEDRGLSGEYMDQLATVTEGLPPTILVHGLNPVTSTTL